jgi:aspartyl-tRNA(Asn)/glutamyl-tRNA(Gln) amidotransferase subunit A
MLPGALGSQTGGSTLRPAAYNGVVGVKPSFGLISFHGGIPTAWSFDTVGILSRSVQDAGVVLEALAGYVPRDPSSLRRTRPADRVGNGADVRPPRIGLVRDYFLETCEPEVRSHTETVAERLNASH